MLDTLRRTTGRRVQSTPRRLLLPLLLSVVMVKGWTVRASLVLLGTVLGLIVSEESLRLTDYGGISYFVYLEATYGMRVPASDPMLGWEYPRSMRHELNHSYRTNDLGFRGEEIALEKSPSVSRLLFLGDSVVFGMSVDQGEDFPALVQRDLAGGSYGPYEVINGGVIGYNLIQSYAAYRNKYAFMQPDRVVLLVISNDGDLASRDHSAFPSESWAASRPTAFMKPEAAGSASDETPSILSFPYLRALSAYGQWSRAQRPVATSNWDGHLRIDPTQNGWQRNLDALEELSREVRQSEGRLLVASERYSPQLEELTRQWSLPYLPLYFGEAKMRDQSLRRSRIDPHPSRRGHRWIADRFMRYCEETGWLRTPAD